jgi:predicted enzyme related to lactoylglutathione lyase
MPRPIHFEIPAENPERAIEFYAKTLGWKFTKWDGPMEYWVISTGPKTEPGIDGGLMRRYDPAQPCVNTISVEDLDSTVQTVLANGGAIALPKMAVPGVGWLAYCKDLEGYIFGLMQNDPGAH